MEQLELCAFWVEDHLFGIDVALVQEIVRDQRETPIPLSAPAIRGLINLRGQVVTVVDLRSCLGMPPREDDSSVYVVIRHGKEQFCLYVDRMMGVLNEAPDDFERPTDQAGLVARSMVKGVFKHDGDLLLLLDLERVLEACQ